MKHGFLKVSSISPKIILGDCKYNVTQIIKHIEEEYKKNTKLVVFPELILSGVSVLDMFFQETLMKNIESKVEEILLHTKDKGILIFLGLPFLYENNLYNTVFAIFKGKILGIVPKSDFKNSDIDEKRYFKSYEGENIEVEYLSQRVLFGNNIIFSPKNYPLLKIGVEVGDEKDKLISKAYFHSMNGANVIVNPNKKREFIYSKKDRKEELEFLSKKLKVAYISSSIGEGESSSEFVFSASTEIAELGEILQISDTLFENVSRSEIDLEKINSVRRNNIDKIDTKYKYDFIDFEIEIEKCELSRKILKNPFIKNDLDEDEVCKNILSIQAHALRKRLLHTNIKKLVLGISGGLDSSLALLSCVECLDLMNIERKNILAISMPAFGTTSRTKNNAKILCESLGVSFKEISIKKSIDLHFKDIEKDIEVKDVTYENAQARERTQILMDLANKENALVIGTGDLSELVLGFATYNGDHMSMYGINASVTKTLIRKVVFYYQKISTDKKLKKVLLDILDTPISPELLPLEKGVLQQKTEEIVGPYILHDFFLYYFLKFKFSPRKIYYLAKQAFLDEYKKEDIKKYLGIFIRRFFTSQFKRTCQADGASVLDFSVSPRGGLFLASDFDFKIWEDEIKSIDD